MSEFLQALLLFPTVIFTAMLGVSLAYWLLIIIGAADLNPFDGAEGALKGGVEGAMKGAVEGAAKGAAEGIGESAGASAFSEVLAFLGLTRVPITISFSLFSLFAWFIAFATRDALDGVLPNALSALAATGAATVGGMAITSFLTRPLASVFTEKPRPGGKGLVGRTVKVTTERVDDQRGQGEVDDGGGGITVTIRSAADSGLVRGDEAVIIEADGASGVYWVEPIRSLLPTDQQAFADASKAAEATHAMDSARDRNRP